MNFNSVVFLFCFCRWRCSYYLVPGRVKNAVLLVESLLFFLLERYRHGCPLTVCMIVFNYLWRAADSLRTRGKLKVVLIAGMYLTTWRRWSTASIRIF